MSKHPSPQKSFQSSIKQVTPTLNAYIRTSKSSTYACIILHQHLGLVENIMHTVQSILGPDITIVIPDLFMSVTSKTLLNNQFDGVRKLKISRVVDVLQTCVRELGNRFSRFVLIGFSIGSAYGWKVLETVHAFEIAFLFYGTPNPKTSTPQTIQTKLVSISASDDKIKYLSDYNTYQELAKKCKGNKQIKFEQINGVGHGFMNPDCPNFSEKGLMQVREIMGKYLEGVGKMGKNGAKGEDGGDGKKEDCLIF